MNEIPDYQEATDMEVVVIEYVRNSKVSQHILDRDVAAIGGSDNSARIVRRRPISNTYKEALVILNQRAIR